MKCNQVQKLLARYLRDELDTNRRDLVNDHVADCADCREWVAFHRSLDARMDSEVDLPSGVHEKILDRIALPQRPLIFGDSKMKKIAISSSAIVAIVAGAFLVMPRSANAASPLEKFKRMRTAFSKAAQQGEITINVDSHKDGSVDVTGTINGTPIPAGFPLRKQIDRDGNVLTVRITVDMDPASYQSIRYGKNENTLVVVPKNNPKQKVEIGLNAKTSLPVSWNATGVTAHPTVEFIGKTPDGREFRGTGRLIDATVKLYVGSKASVTAR